MEADENVKLESVETVLTPQTYDLRSRMLVIFTFDPIIYYGLFP